jgi:AcrR family transcriptional regulator
MVSASGPAPAPQAILGRRERKKLDTYRRIFTVAEALFSRKGYAAVTTQEIAEAADIGTGTLFRYAQTKAEMLIMVMNERLRLGTTHGLAVAEGGATAAESILALVEPLLQASVSQPENTSIFQREVLFGADGPHRTEALRQIDALEAAIVVILRRHTERREPRTAADLERVATTIVSVAYLKLVRAELGRVKPASLPEIVKADVDFLIQGLLDSA